MEIVNRTPMKVGMIGGRVYFPTPSLTIVVKGTFDLVPGEPARMSDEQVAPTGDEPFEDEGEPGESLRYESDFAYFKPSADLLLVGKAHAPEGDPVPHLRVGFRVGSRGKFLSVFGDRWWGGDGIRPGATQPAPFATMSLRYENAFGGPSFRPNPVGKGFSRVASEWGYDVWPLPNLEDPGDLVDSPGAVRFPAGFGPLNRTWEWRFGKVGRYTGPWLQTRWPWLAEDFDWSYFNAAPPDMQVDGYLRGDEEIVLDNLDPHLPHLSARLPGIRVRCFLSDDSEGALEPAERDRGDDSPVPAGGTASEPPPETRFREVEMNLDTLWVDAEERKLVLVWRGVADVASPEDHEELRHLLIVSEELTSAPRPAAVYRAELDEEEGEPVDEGELPGAKEPSGPSEGGPTDEEMEAEVTASVEEMNAELAAAGLPPVEYSADPPPPPPPSPEADAASQALMEDYGIEAEAEPDLPSGPLSRSDAEARLQEGESLSEEDLTGADLSGMDLTGVDLSGALLAGAVLLRTVLDRADLTGANLEEADLTGALLREANLTGTDLTRAVVVEADLSMAVLRDAVLGGADLRASRLDRAQAQGAALPGANLDDTSAVGSQLSGADLTGATLRRANLRSADLSEACLEGAVAEKADFSEGVLAELQASEGADFTNALFRDARAPESIWSGSRLVGADLSFSVLEGADFTEAVLDGASLVGTDLRFARLVKASLVQARMVGCNLFEASVEKAVLDDADLSGASLYGAEVLDARWDGARLDGANLKMTKFQLR